LKTSGLARACAVSKENVPTSKFVYPKFDSTALDFDYEALMASI